MTDPFHPTLESEKAVAMLLKTVFFAMLLAAGAAAAADVFPERPVRLIVPFTAGGTTDVNARAIGAQLERQLGQPFVVDNRAGANGIIATDLVVKSAPDGHTLLYTSSAVALNPSMYRKLPYDTLKDLAPVTRVASAVGFLVVANLNLSANNARELVALSKTGAKVAFGSAGIGNPLHLAGEVFMFRTGAQMLHVPYKGISLALNAVMGNEVQLVFLPPTIAVPQIKAGKVKALGFSGQSRWPLLPEVATLGESIPGLQIPAGWDAVFAPAATPANLVTKLQTELRKAVQAPKVREQFIAGGYDPLGESPEVFRKFFLSEIRRYADIIREAKIQPE
jgi:tripartite-type tricarboxylate transporter receptor subunit TctC